RIFRSVWALITEINQGFHYLAGVPALLGLCWTFGSLRRNPSFWLLVAYAVIHSGILIALAMVACYVSDRHVMILVLLGCFFAVAGLLELPRRVLAWFQVSELADATVAAWKRWARSAPVWFA